MKRILPFLAISILISCSPKISESSHAIQSGTAAVKQELSVPTQENLMLAVLWQQLASEYKALCYQSYNLARLRLDQHLLEHDSNMPLAIITDIDETVLDNSPYSGKLIETDIKFTAESWDTWVNLESAEPVPGAVDFLNYAASKNVDIFYISNREYSQTQATINNLKKEGLPFADAAHVLLQTDTSNKDLRRQSVLKTHHVIMYLGDNLGDFDSVYDHKTTPERHKITDSLQSKYGASYIVFPNPMYGAWEYGLYNKNPYGINDVKKDSLRRAKLKSY
ncbi:acid phosphatase [Formosa agariphila KMM 3901]|uniref:Acid phosphatase n=1 Tax=Formosa agariphila (strain DSM 15362 / KCTC 12365 / LMG 23005 / KMM 3901 / M-2Alg 35-1) TaxID=1347342 RepID=T2KKC5_FORAG|nr:5'-nucleotidase, lipoprotein e(P4) family [Formosa agariphila]CDF79327.1 acid phosphatase [Formosa agariphila KMM 3901]